MCEAVHNRGSKMVEENDAKNAVAELTTNSNSAITDKDLERGSTAAPVAPHVNPDKMPQRESRDFNGE
jgi:hypothetical protein